MRNFRYIAPARPEEALKALAEPGAVAIAGGTELLNWMRLGMTEPQVLVDLGRLEQKNRIALEGDRLWIGASATLNEVGESAAIRQRAAALSQACLKAASAQVRNRATIGGNVLQKTRCPYFRAEAPLPWACNKRQPGAGCAARDGLNETHAILGWTDDCVATQPSDPAVALACLDAEVEVLGPNGRRVLAMTDFHLTQAEAAAETRGLSNAARSALVETRLQPGELIMGYHIPLRRGERQAYVKVRERESFEYALVSAAATAEVTGTRIRSVRLALGSVAQKPWRLHQAEAALVDRPLTREAVLPTLRAALAEARPLAHNGYKIELAARAALRALMTAGGEE
jgi:xanthine dehydrogenase YagS FAD-binding subunit